MPLPDGFSCGLEGHLDDSRAQSGGFGFTWPAHAPMTRLDHVLGKGLSFTSDTVVETEGSDHRGVVAGVHLN